MPAHPKANPLFVTPSRRRYLPAVPSQTSVPRAPTTLNVAGKGIWAMVWQLGNGVYTASDTFVIERYASLQSRRVAMLAVLEREGEFSSGAAGQVVAHPAAKLLADIETKLVGLEDRLGLNPEARVRLGVAQVEARSKLDEFLADDE